MFSHSLDDGWATTLPYIGHSLASVAFMKTDLSMSLLCAVGVTLTGCLSLDPVAPDTGLEPIPAQVVQHRTAGTGERLSGVDVSGGIGAVTVRVTTRALCATLVSAQANQSGDEINVVSRVTPNPAANCAPIPANAVVDYVSTVSDVAAGSYRVRVFEGRGRSEPKLIGSKMVSVTRNVN
jgi:hypothetical protein